MYVVFRQSRCKTTAVDMHVITDLDCYHDRIKLSFSRQLQICLKYGRDAKLISRTPTYRKDTVTIPEFRDSRVALKF
jgi:hypothetical protein